MNFRKLTSNEDEAYAGIRNNHEFHWHDWMDDYSTHRNQKELVARYEIADRIKADRFSHGMQDGFHLYNTLTGHRFDYGSFGRRTLRYCSDFLNELLEDFPHYECFDHTVSFKNSGTGKIIVSSLVYLDTRTMIKASCDKWGFDVEFIPYDGKRYDWMYVLYSARAGHVYRLPEKYSWRAL